MLHPQRSALAAIAVLAAACQSTPRQLSGASDAAPMMAPDAGAGLDSALAPPDAASSADASIPAPDGCTVLADITLATRPGSPNALVGHFSPQLGSATPDELSIELYETAGYHLTPGTFDLSSAPETDYSTCHHCVLVFEDGTATGPASRKFFQASGEMTLDSVNSPPNGESKGSLAGVKLVEVVIDTNFHAAPVAGGGCLFIPSASWDTRVAVGHPCLSASDCGDVSTKVCDPVTQQCALQECGTGGQACADPHKTCLVQSMGETIGACYPTCTPFTLQSCPTGQDCITFRYDRSNAVCLAQGSSAANANCTPNEVSTSCAPNHLCVPDASANVCRELCDFFASTSTCSTMGQHCTVGDICTSRAFDPAMIATVCNMPDGTPCALEGGAFRGVCTAGNTGVMCRRWCHLAQPMECDAGKACHDVFLTGTLGVCTL
jgi:hypothetical protein